MLMAATAATLRYIHLDIGIQALPPVSRFASVLRPGQCLAHPVLGGYDHSSQASIHGTQVRLSLGRLTTTCSVGPSGISPFGPRHGARRAWVRLSPSRSAQTHPRWSASYVKSILFVKKPHNSVYITALLKQCLRIPLAAIGVEEVTTVHVYRAG